MVSRKEWFDGWSPGGVNKKLVVMTFICFPKNIGEYTHMYSFTIQRQAKL